MNTTQIILTTLNASLEICPASLQLSFLKKKQFFRSKKAYCNTVITFQPSTFASATSQAMEDEVFKVSGEFKNATQHKFLPRHVPLLSQNFTPKLFSVRAARWSKDFAFFLNSTASRETSSGYSWKARVSKLLSESKFFPSFFFSVLGKNDLKKFT